MSPSLHAPAASSSHRWQAGDHAGRGVCPSGDAIEVKLRRSRETESDALDQLTRYLVHAGLEEGWLVLFDLRKRQSWAKRLTVREVAHRSKRIHIVGC